MEFTEWRAFFRLWPSIEDRLDMVIGALSGIHPDYAAHYREPDELPTEEQTADQVHAFFSHLAAQHSVPARRDTQH